MKSLNSLLKCPSNRGAGFLGMWKRTFMGCMAALGGSPFASSIAVIPSDQMSALQSYSGFLNGLFWAPSKKACPQKSCAET